jgi:hypothetical protein
MVNQLRYLTQLAQLEDTFRDFTDIGVSPINGLDRARSRFWYVVPTLGIDAHRRA